MYYTSNSLKSRPTASKFQENAIKKLNELFLLLSLEMQKRANFGQVSPKNVL